MSKKTNNYIFSLIAEFLFIFLPIIVVFIIRISNEQYSAIFYNSEWAFAAVILYGQAIIKLSSGAAAGKMVWQRLSLIISILLVFGLIPTIVILYINFTTTQPSLGMHIFQIIELMLASIVFFLFGAIGDSILHKD